MLVIVGLMVVIVVGVKGVVFWNKLAPVFTPEFKNFVSSELVDELAEAVSKSELTANEAAVLEELTEFAKDGGTSYASSVLIFAVSLQSLEDGQITEQENEALYLVRDLLLEKNGKISFRELVTLQKTNPQIKDMMGAFKKEKREGMMAS